MNLTKHKPIVHRKCGKRMPDKGEHIKDGKSVEHGDIICECYGQHNSVFTSRPQPVDLQAYDKFNK